MKIDIITIFPDYFSSLNLSLTGKAVENGIITIRVHDLRDYTHDAHNSVDDTPYGGGPGMVMRADVWGEALDAHVQPDSRIIVPTPVGSVFKQADAQHFSQHEHLIFVCGRYEGIDQRVMDFYAEQIQEVSLGDYVLIGGEVAALAIIEATTRLIPGVLGNKASHQEDSFAGEQLLEGPRYTRPRTWRGLEIPEVLLSGNHSEIAAWNRQCSLDRTRERRPDLLL